ncbi:MAG TPA: TlpA disulfide reductase family protein [Candidatus Binatia bacterium]|nr:TlpA disulfide reductase family protein [Candidatus Binatia bacterium]
MRSVRQLSSTGSLLAALCPVLLGICLAAQNPAQPPAGLWDGTIQSKAGEVNFGIELQPEAGGAIKATLLNASDRQPFSSARWNDGVLTLRMDYYDGQLTAHVVSPQRMEGEYSRQTSRGMVHIPVVLVSHAEAAGGKPWSGPSLAGEWLFHWPEETGAEKTTLASFRQQKSASADGKVPATGIIEPVSGDTGLLHGSVFTAAEGKTHFHLSRFDGIHALAIDGEFQSDGTLKGEQGGIVALEPFTAERSRDTAAADPNALAETLTHVKDPGEPFRFGGVDHSGTRLDQSSPEFRGRPLIVDIFGTWCPNCHDEAPVLEKLYRKYHDRGLEVVGLGYEYTDDTTRNLRQIAIYREKFGITFPLLLSGTTAEGQIAKTLPQLVGFGAFPTSIFIDRAGHVHAILAGFTGPSTGEKYQQVQQRMDELAGEIVRSTN